MIITIKGKEYKAEVTLRAMMAFEEATGKAFEIKTMSDIIKYCFCIILANNDEVELELKDFVEALDEEPQIMQSFNDLLQSKKKEVMSLQENLGRA